jgi:hypothetical protein
MPTYFRILIGDETLIESDSYIAPAILAVLYEAITGTMQYGDHMITDVTIATLGGAKYIKVILAPEVCMLV